MGRRNAQTVKAAKLVSVEILEDGQAKAVTDEGEVYVQSAEWAKIYKGAETNDPGYIVELPDGQRTWSPTQAFEEGYFLSGE